ncbi:uncharacterized protein B0T23DRAFT_398479 [Neurospora hispaniola]|uniref:Dicer-like protein 1 n=1 Tax=Neurospora hispaniola TaxID=588809 RepID=A0AAJ0MNM7_9PEZI|nr:hypothetical protein B0T23DRAFT_398479 [Neurospora hispaniola]
MAVATRLPFIPPEATSQIIGDEDLIDLSQEDVASENDDRGNASDVESEDGVKRWTVNPEPKPKKISAKKLADTAAFNSWIEEHQETLARDQRKAAIEAARSVGVDVLPAIGFDSERIITSPREYQVELFERAKQQNTIAVLDTGSGKTLIAAMLLRWVINGELEDREKGLPRRIAFFLVDKVALVFQQHSFLTKNLDFPMEKLCGEMVEGVESKAFWKEALEQNEVVVCTAEILSTALHHSWIRMDQINLLIFDEAHHTKKDHPYARIIKNFYIDEQLERRPRILGLTASPVDAKVDPRRAAAELEALLHSQIATAADPAALQHTICKPKTELIVEYVRGRPDSETVLNKQLRKLVGGQELFKKPLNFTTSAASKLGTWCADRYWQLFFKQEDIVKLESRTERDHMKVAALDEITEKHVKQVREAHELVNAHTFSPAALDPTMLSSKVIMLVRILRDQFERGVGAQRCIIFVRQRNTAMLLADLLQQPEIRSHIPSIAAEVLVGGGTTGSSYVNAKINFQQQNRIIRKFKLGEINCLFATSVAEEGLDIPDCNIVIRFDLYDTLIQCIQSRGRARRPDSRYIQMIEKGNYEHHSRILRAKGAEDVLRKFCEALPEDRKLTGNHMNLDYLLRKEKGKRQYTVPDTGAKLSYMQSLVCLANFTATLPHPPETSLSPEYYITTVPGGFQCEVVMPDASPIKSAVGKVHLSKGVAKCAAAFELCLALLKAGHLDNHLQSVFTKQLPEMRNARLAVSSKKKTEYAMRLKPELWSVRGVVTQLFATAFVLENPDTLGRSSRPLLLLSRSALPEVASFPLFFGTKRFSRVRCVPIPGSVQADETLVEQLTCFTLKAFMDVFSKEYEATAVNLPYFLSPMDGGHGFDFRLAKSPAHLIDRKTLAYVSENEKVPYTFLEPDDFFQDKFVVDPYDGARKFFTHHRRHDMKPTDSVPDGIVAPNHRAWRGLGTTHDILNYSNSLWSKSRGFMIFQADQPVVEAALISTRRDFLDDTLRDEDAEPQQCFLILEPMRISPIPADVVAMLLCFPSIIHRVESNLVALDACKLLGLDLRPDLALEAFTKDSDNSDEHDAEKENYQTGMGDNYERLEFLGDSFLKMATTIAIYTLIPDKGEFEYHVERMLLICNKNLFNNALEIGLEEYIRSMSFNRRQWYPEGLILKKGKSKDARQRHVLADKSIADVCEALIGAAYLTGQEKGSFDLAIKAVTAMVKDKKHRMISYGDYYAVYQKPNWQTDPANSAQRDMAKKFSERLGYSFKHPRLLRAAFQHPTYPSLYERLPSYQRLEFLGDALFDMVAVDYLFRKFPATDPQWLTEHKMAMVSNQFLCCLSFHLGFNKCIATMSPSILKDIAEYVTEIEEALEAAKQEAIKAGKPADEYSRDYWVHITHASRLPKCLSDVVEAYIGAIFVDSEYDYSVVQNFFNTHVLPFFEDMHLYDTFANKHPVTFVANMMAHKFRCNEWRSFAKELDTDVTEGRGGRRGNGAVAGEISEINPPKVVSALLVHGKTVVHAVAASGRYAKSAMAKKAIKLLEGMSVEEFRERLGCNCKGVPMEVDGGVPETDVDGEVHGTAV